MDDKAPRRAPPATGNKGRPAPIVGFMSRKDELICEIDRLEGHLPGWAVWLLQTTLAPRAIWVRVPLALALMAGGFVGFLPILGFWMLPLGLALLAVDVPFLRRPMARLVAFINGKLAKA